MFKNYTISSFNDIDKLVNQYGLTLVQATCNQRQFPTKRRVNSIISSQKADVPIVIHYDFIYTISRWLFYTDSVREAILDELVTYRDPRIVGVVMHADSLVARDVEQAKLSNKLTDSFVFQRYSSPIWDNSDIFQLLSDYDTYQLFVMSIDAFLKEYKYYDGPTIFLENTTKTPGGVKTLEQFVSDSVKICFDTEHYFATNGIVKSNLNPSSIGLIHMNPIPEGVAPRSFIDRHSETTLFECSQYKMEYYEKMHNYCVENNIPYVRECFQDTMVRELEQFSNYGY